MTGGVLDPASADCLERTRSAVMTLLVVDGLAIALSGLLLRGRGGGITLMEPAEAYRWSYLALLALMMIGSLVRVVGTTRWLLGDPGRRGRRFYWSHVASAAAGLPALGLGFAYGWAIRPSLSAVAPYWGVALVLGVLALPRVDELIGFDRPMTPRPPGGGDGSRRAPDGIG